MSENDDPFAEFRIRPSAGEATPPPPAVDPYAELRGRPGLTPGPGPGEFTVQGQGKGTVLPPVTQWGQSIGEGLTDATRAGANTLSFGSGNRIAAGISSMYNGKTYNENLQNVVAEEAAARGRSPWATTGADLAAGAAQGLATGKAFPTAPGFWNAVGSGGRQGAVLGGLQGAGNTYTGNPSDYAENALQGGIYGGMGGIIAPAFGVGAGKAIKSVAGLYSEIPPNLARAARTDATGIADLAAGKLGPNALLVDAGPSLRGVGMGSVVNPELPGANKLITTLTKRNEGTQGRVKDAVTALGPTEPPSFTRDYIQTQIGRLSPRYTDAYNNAGAVDTRPVADYLDAQIRNAPPGPLQSKLLEARRGLNIYDDPNTLDPRADKLEKVRGQIKDTIDDPSTGSDTRRLLTNTYNQITSELHARVPGIQQLDSERAELGRQQRALEPGSVGLDAFDRGKGTQWPAEFQRDLTEGARPTGVLIGPSGEAFRISQAGRASLENIVGTHANDLNTLKSLLGEPHDWNQQKLAQLFGQDRADRLMGVINNEINQRNSYNKIVEGSKTATTSAAAKAQEPAELPAMATRGVWGDIKSGLYSAGNAMLRKTGVSRRDDIAHLLATDPSGFQTLVPKLLAAQPTNEAREALTRAIIENSSRGAAAGVVGKRQNQPPLF